MQLREQQILMSSLMNFGRYVIKLNCYMVEIVHDEKETSAGLVPRWSEFCNVKR